MHTGKKIFHDDKKPKRLVTDIFSNINHSGHDSSVRIPVTHSAVHVVSDEVVSNENNAFFSKWEKDKRFENNQEEFSSVLGSGKSRWGIVGSIVFVGLLLASAGYASMYALPRATITVQVEKIPIAITEELSVSANLTRIATATDNGLIPGILEYATTVVRRTVGEAELKQFGNNNNTETFSRGKLLVRNTGIVKSFTIVKGSRLKSVEGKIYRTEKNFTIEGVSSKSGSTEVMVDVVAEKAGDSYNVLASQNKEAWHFVGFLGSAYDKYVQAFVSSDISGGGSTFNASGQESAEASLRAVAETDLISKVDALSDKNQKALRGATSISFKPVMVENDPATGKPGILKLESALTRLTFHESVARDMIETRLYKEVETQNATLRIKEMDIEYTVKSVNYDQGTMLLVAKVNATFEPIIHPASLITIVKGEDEVSVKRKVFEVEGVESASVSFWPVWVKKVPENEGRIDITIE